MWLILIVVTSYVNPKGFLGLHGFDRSLNKVALTMCTIHTMLIILLPQGTVISLAENLAVIYGMYYSSH